MSALRELQKLLKDAAAPSKLTLIQKKDPKYIAGVADGFRMGIEEAIEITIEEADD